jgi:hypothetical protein
VQYHCPRFLDKANTRQILKSEITSFHFIEKLNEYYISKLDNDLFSYKVITIDLNTCGQFLSFFTEKELIAESIVKIMLNRLHLLINIEDFRMNSDKMFTLINDQISQLEKSGIEVSPSDFIKIALNELDKIENPSKRASFTWDLIQEMKKPELFDREILIHLCNQINRKDFPHYEDASLLKTELYFTDGAPEISMELRYLPSIETLLECEGSEAQRTRTLFANAYREGGTPGGTTISNLSPSKETIIQLLKIVHEKNQRIKELEVTLNK